MKNFTSLIAALFCFLAVKAQNKRELHSISSNIPNEKVYVHVNTSMPFVGEYLYFKLYCLQAGTNQPSNISKIAYLDLINENKEVVYSQTIDLKNGMGYGDYFLPTHIASGNYKLLAYTRWMENNEEKKFFQQDIFIINPYTSAQANIRRDSVLYEKVSVDSGQSEKLVLKKVHFGKREKVEVSLPGLPEGNYSVSVKQVDSLPHPVIVSAADTEKKGGSYKYAEDNNYLIPDLRGKLLKGKISSKEDNSLENVKLSFTVPGKDYFLRIANTDENGDFYFSVDENFVEEDALIQILDDQTSDYNITLDPIPSPDIDNLTFENFGIDSLARQMILDKSVHNQIENAYFSLKPDTLKVNHPKNLFEGIDKIVYNLGDYTQFETIKETFVEVIPYARVRKVNDKYEFGVLGHPPYENFQGQPLVVVDGLPLKDTDGFIRGYEAAKIDKIKIIQDKYYLGASMFKGVIIIETKNGDFTENYYKDYLKRIKLTTGNVRKNYFQQNYEKNKQSNIPDYRSQLLWLPSLKKSDFHFYTSDVHGIFKISIQGFTDEGEPVSLERTFEVR